MVSRKELFQSCVSELTSNNIPDAEFDIMCIFQDATGEKQPLFKPEEIVQEKECEIIVSMTEKRKNGFPLQYILGQWEFYGYPFKVGEGVLIPRPDTETLIETVLDICRREKLASPRIIDLCSGSGCIAVTLKKQIPGSQVSAVEFSPEALGYLRENIALNNADIRLIKADVTAEDTAAGEYDIIVSNPPYLTAQEMAELQTEVAFEPAMALDGGGDGLYFYRKITQLWKKNIRPGGWLCFEFGMGQHQAVCDILKYYNFENITLRRDLGHIIRTAAAQRPEES